jgi:hypothetical protein
VPLGEAWTCNGSGPKPPGSLGGSFTTFVGSHPPQAAAHGFPQAAVAAVVQVADDVDDSDQEQLGETLHVRGKPRMSRPVEMCRSQEERHIGPGEKKAALEASLQSITKSNDAFRNQPPALSFDAPQPALNAPAPKPAPKTVGGKRQAVKPKQPKASGANLKPSGANLKPSGAKAAKPNVTVPAEYEYPFMGRLAPSDNEPRVPREAPQDKSKYLDGSYDGEETPLTSLFLLQVGQELLVSKRENGFFFVEEVVSDEWKAWLGTQNPRKRARACIQGWLRESSVSIVNATTIEPTAADGDQPTAAADDDQPAADADAPDADAADADAPLKEGYWVPRAILETRAKGTRTEYLVAWEGWPDPSSNTWQTKTSIAQTAVFKAYVHSRALAQISQ